jgi:hypothetical protein
MLAGLCKKRRRWKAKPQTSESSGQGRTSRRNKSELCCYSCRAPGPAPQAARDPPTICTGTAADEIWGLLGQSDHEKRKRKRKRREVVARPSPGACSGEKHAVSSCEDASFSLIPPTASAPAPAPASGPFCETLVQSAPSLHLSRLLVFKRLCLLGSAFIFAFLARLHQHCIGPQSCTTLDRTLSRIDQH